MTTVAPIGADGRVAPLIRVTTGGPDGPVGPPPPPPQAATRMTALAIATAEPTGRHIRAPLGWTFLSPVLQGDSLEDVRETRAVTLILAEERCDGCHGARRPRCTRMRLRATRQQATELSAQHRNVHDGAAPKSGRSHYGTSSSATIPPNPSGTVATPLGTTQSVPSTSRLK